MDKSKFYVVEATNNLTSYSERLDAAESFNNEVAALRRAKALAENEPGETFYICKVTHAVVCPVGKPEVERA